MVGLHRLLSVTFLGECSSSSPLELSPSRIPNSLSMDVLGALSRLAAAQNAPQSVNPFIGMAIQDCSNETQT